MRSSPHSACTASLLDRVCGDAKGRPRSGCSIDAARRWFASRGRESRFHRVQDDGSHSGFPVPLLRCVDLGHGRRSHPRLAHLCGHAWGDFGTGALLRPKLSATSRIWVWKFHSCDERRREAHAPDVRIPRHKDRSIDHAQRLRSRSRFGWRPSDIGSRHCRRPFYRHAHASSALAPMRGGSVESHVRGAPYVALSHNSPEPRWFVSSRVCRLLISASGI